MISVEQALDKILGFVNVLEVEEKPLLDCLGQVLAEDIYAPFDVPPRDNSAMDGYALQTGSIVGASYESPVTLRIIGELPAGSTTDYKVIPGTAVRIMTGAIVPDSADVVVPFELTDEIDTKRSSTSNTDVCINKELSKGANIRRQGEDISKGDLVIERGKILRPADIGILASLGKAAISVIRRPIVAILATGDEVADISEPLPPGKIYNSNTYSVAAQIMKYGGIPRILGIAPDDIDKLSDALRSGLDCDMLITSGGVSKGDYDIVKDVLAREGDVSFWTVKMKPGKPLAFGTFNGKYNKKVPHLGLPGNPVSTMITFEVFARPSILKMMGKTDLNKPVINAVLEDHIKKDDNRRYYARVIVDKKGDRYYARLTGPQGSGILSSVLNANGLAVIPEEIQEVKPGTDIKVMMLNWDEEQNL